MSGRKPKLSGRELEQAILDEAQLDIAAVVARVSRPAGPLQKAYPEEYKAAHGLLCSMGLGMGRMAMSLTDAERLSSMLHAKDEGLNSIQDALKKNPLDAWTLMILIHLERKRRPSRAEISVAKTLASGRRKGTLKRQEQSLERKSRVMEMNADLLRQGSSEGWTIEARASHIAERVGLSESYVRKLIAASRKTHQA